MWKTHTESYQPLKMNKPHYPFTRFQRWLGSFALTFPFWHPHWILFSNGINFHQQLKALDMNCERRINENILICTNCINVSGWQLHAFEKMAGFMSRGFDKVKTWIAWSWTYLWAVWFALVIFVVYVLRGPLKLSENFSYGKRFVFPVYFKNKSGTLICLQQQRVTE